MYYTNMKVLFVILTLVISLFLLNGYFISNTNLSNIDSCLDKGYCWDYIRNRCEEKDQGFCVKSEQECKDKHGKWLYDKKYCLLY